MSLFSNVLTRAALRRAFAQTVPSAALGLALAVLLVASAVTTNALAGSRSHGASPERIYVFGDSVARDLWHGLKMAYRRDGSVKIIRRAKSATGLVRTDRYDWFRVMRRVTSREKIDTAIILIGGNDRQDIRTGSRRLERFSEPWKKNYAARVDAFTAYLTRRGVKVYWIGLPVVRSRRMERDYRMMNAIYRSRAKINGATYIDIFQYFRSNGRYAAYGRTVSGKKRKLRDSDGLHFTMAGSRVLAEIVADRLHARRTIATSAIQWSPPPARRNPRRVRRQHASITQQSIQ